MSEHQQQAALFQWAKTMEGQYPELFLLYATPNQGRRTPRQGQWMVEEGMKAGVPDVCLPVPNKYYGAFYIELKDGWNKKPTETQKIWIDSLRAVGNMAEVYGDWEAAAAAIIQYLKEGR